VSGRRRLAISFVLGLVVIAAGSAQAFTVKSYSTYLGEVRTMLGQWHPAIENFRGHHFMIAPDSSNTANAAALQSLLNQWYGGLENEHGSHFLLPPTTDATDSVFDLHSLLNQWQNAIEAWKGVHFILEPPGPYTASTTPTKTGSFSLQPRTPTVEVGERADYEIRWKVPNPNNWHDLKTIDLQVCGDHRLLLVRWTELENTLYIRDGRTVAAGQVGDDKTIQIPTAEVELESSSVTGNGETGRKVTLVIDLTFKQRAAGTECGLLLAAADDLGNRDPFRAAGKIRIGKA
jgi:hypothetical protein